MSSTSLALGNLRACVIIIVLAFHSVLAYLGSNPVDSVPFASPPYRWTIFPIIDSQRWFGFDLFCAFQNVYLMSFMFFLSGLFVWPSLARNGRWLFLSRRFLRLCLPAVLFALLLMPLTLYATYLVTAADPSLIAFWRQWLALPFWPSGPMWFLWQLFALNIFAVGLHGLAPRCGELLCRLSSSAHARPSRYCFGLVIASGLAYVPLALIFDPWRWVEYGPFAIQPSRPLHYAVYFFAGLGIGAYGIERGLLAVDGMLARRWTAWLAAAFAAFLFWMAMAWLSMENGTSNVLGVQLAGDIAFVLSCASGCCSFAALFVRFGARRSRLLAGLSENAYGMYLVHYVFVVWLQYAMLDAALPAVVKAAFVFGVTLILSWVTTAAMCRIPLCARLIGAERLALAKVR